MYGNDYRYAATRLDDTIARLADGTPVYIHNVNAEGNVFYFLLEDMDKMGKGPKAAKLEKFNLEPVPLGYVNTDQGCTYVSRMPVRKWKQGLRLNENCCADYGRRVAVKYEALTDTIKGIFPKYEEVVNKKEDAKNNPFKKVGQNILRAWHRFWAYDIKNEDVYYRGEVVGKMVEGKVVLNPSFKYLQECLMESV